VEIFGFFSAEKWGFSPEKKAKGGNLDMTKSGGVSSGIAY